MNNKTTKFNTGDSVWFISGPHNDITNLPILSIDENDPYPYRFKTSTCPGLGDTFMSCTESSLFATKHELLTSLYYTKTNINDLKVGDRFKKDNMSIKPQMYTVLDINKSGILIESEVTAPAYMMNTEFVYVLK